MQGEDAQMQGECAAMKVRVQEEAEMQGELQEAQLVRDVVSAALQGASTFMCVPMQANAKLRPKAKVDVETRWRQRWRRK